MKDAITKAGVRASAIPTPAIAPVQPTPAPAQVDPVVTQPVTQPPIVASGDDDFQLVEPDQYTAPDPTATPTATEPPVVTTPDPNQPELSLSPDEQSLINDLRDLRDPSPNALPERLLSSILKLPRGQRMAQAFKATQELGKPIEEGGIGISPNVDQIKSWFSSHAQLTDLNYQLESGDRAAISSALQGIFTTPDPSTGQLSLRPGIETVLPGIYNEIATVAQASGHPELYHSAVRPIHDAKFGALVDHIKDNFPGGEEGSEAQRARDAAIWAIKKVVAPFYGHQVTDDHFTVRQADPAMRVVEENKQLRQRLANQQTQQVEGAWEGFLDQVASTQIPRLNSYIDQSLNPIKTQFPGPVYETLTNQFRSNVLTALSSDPHYLREANPILNRIRQSNQFLNGGAVELAKQVAQIQDRHLQRIIPAHRQSFLSSLRGTGPSPQTQPPPPNGQTAQPSQVVSPSPASMTGQSPVDRTQNGQPPTFSVQPGRDAVDAIQADAASRMRQAMANRNQLQGRR